MNKEAWELELFDVCNIRNGPECSVDIQRVPGGWSKDTTIGSSTSSTFIPFISYEDMAQMNGKLVRFDGWVDVKHEMPVDHEDVMVWYYDECLIANHHSTPNGKSVWTIIHGDMLNGEITHWKPLPGGPGLNEGERDG